MNENTLLTVQNLKTYFYTYQGIVKAVDDVDFDVRHNEVKGIVGESGCGKSVTALSIMRLIRWPPGRIIDGKIIFEGEDLIRKNEREIINIRGNKISMIFQEPMSSLNPIFKVGDQISELIRLHQRMTKKEAIKKAIDMIRKVNIPDPEKVAKQYPHELSGGMCQRIMIAMAISSNPKLLIADEPTSFLDVTIQAQIIDLLCELKRELNNSIIIITHNLGVIAQICDRMSVMYLGHIVEEGNTKEVFRNHKHPYTAGLLKAIPKITGDKYILRTIEGAVPSSINPPSGCVFEPRCPYAMTICKKKIPPRIDLGDGHLIYCFLNNS